MMNSEPINDTLPEQSAHVATSVQAEPVSDVSTVDPQRLPTTVNVPAEELDTAPIKRRVLREEPVATVTATQSAIPLTRPSETTQRSVTRRRESDFEKALLGEPAAGEEFAAILSGMSALVRRGMSAREAMLLAAQQARPELRSVITQSLEQDAGGSLAAALTPCAQVLPPLLLPALRAWEAAGQTDRMLQQIVVEIRRLGQSQRQNTFFQIRPLMNRFQAAEQKAMKKRRPKQDEKRLNTSRFGIARRSRATMRWTDLFVSLWRCGVPVAEALEVCGDHCGNVSYRMMLHRAAERSRQGQSLSECLGSSGLLPAGLIDRLHTGEVSGQLDETLEQYAAILQSDWKDLAAQSILMRRIIPLLLLLSAVIVTLFGLALGNLFIGLIGGISVLVVGFILWELVFRLSVDANRDRDTGVGRKAEPQPMPPVAHLPQRAAASAPKVWLRSDDEDVVS